MSDTPPPSALREMRAHLGSPAVLATLAGVSVVLAISGPFRTLDLMPPVPRAAYWAAVVFGTYAIGTAVLTLLHRWPAFARRPPVLRIAGASLLMGLAVTAALFALNLGAGFGPPDDLTTLAGQVALSAVVSAAVLIPQELRSPDQPAQPPSSAPAPLGRTPAILARLPADRRGPLVALSAEDHYVRVTTAAGDSLVLMRLGDALREAAEVPGLQVHRSHWVARGAVRAVRRSGDGAVITLVSGREVPVSRRFMPALRQAGLLAQRTGDGHAGMDHL